MDVFGKGGIPQFDMRGGGSSTPFADLTSQAAATTAAGIDMRNQISDKFTSDSDKFSQGVSDLSDLFSDEDKEEDELDILNELIASREATEQEMADEGSFSADEGSFSFNDLFSPYTSVDEATGETTDQSTGEALLARGTTGLALTPALKRILLGGGMNMPKKIALAVPEVLRIGGSLIAPEATAALEEKIGAGYNEYIDPYVSPVTGAISDKISEIEAAQDIEEQAFKEALLSQGADEESQYFDEAVSGGSMTADELEQYENMISDPLPSFDNYYADGGRIGLFKGGSLRDSGMVKGSSGYGPAGAGGKAQGPKGNQGNNQGGNKKSGPNNTKNTLNLTPVKPAYTPTYTPTYTPEYAPVEDPSVVDKLKQYNIFKGLYGDEDDGLSFGYSVNPFSEEGEAKLKYAFEDGGRVGFNTGGLTYGYTPFMDAQQGLDYYNQFSAPDYSGIADQAEEAVEEAQEDATVVDETLGQDLASGNMGQGDGSGGGYYDFQGGSKGFGDREDTTPDQTTMGFNDEGKLTYTGFASNIDPSKLYGGVQIGDEVPGIFSALNFLGGMFAKSKEDQLQEQIDAHNLAEAQKVLEQQKKDKEAQEQKAAEEAEAQALADEEALAIKEAYIQNQYNNTSGGNNFGPGGGPGTGTYSGGQVSGFTGQGQSPHSSMSTGPQGNQSGKKDGPSNNSNDGVGGGAGPKGGTGRPGDGNKKGPGGCFVEGTLIQMADGSTKEITTIKVGEEIKGGTVQAKMEFMPQNIYNYKDVLVSGSHWVVEDNQLIAVEDSKHGILTDRVEPVYTFKTSDNRIWINNVEFGDFETGTDEDWEPYFEKVRQDLNKKLDEKRR